MLTPVTLAKVHFLTNAPILFFHARVEYTPPPEVVIYILYGMNA